MTRKSIICAIAIATAALVGCSDKSDNAAQFTVTGNITQAEGEMLYLEEIGSQAVTTLDSVRLDAAGAYSFSHAVPQEATFYRLRLNKQSINLVIDTIVSIECNSNGAQFATSSTIAGSDDCIAMRRVDLAGSHLRKCIDSNMASALDSLYAYKQEMTAIALQAPASPVAYYIVLQQVEGLPIFDTYTPEDNKIIAAVATAHEAYYPNLARTQQLKELALAGISHQRNNRPLEVDSEQVNEVNFVDIELYDTAGNLRKLSDATANNRVVLLDFSAYMAEYSPYYNFELKEMYEKYHNRGFEIYQVAFDSEIAAWRSSAGNLPWITVREPNVEGSSLFALYNIQILPTCFLIIDNGAQLIRPEEIDEIEKVLKQKLR